MDVRTHRAFAAGSVALAAALSGCVVELPEDPIVGIEDVVFAESLGIDVADFSETSSGLLIRDDVIGEGQTVTAGEIVSVAFSGWLPNGTLFDSSPGTTFPAIGSGQLIAGFDEGITNMNEGGLRMIIVPPNLGYGDSPPPGSSIPVNSFLIFQIEVLEIQ